MTIAFAPLIAMAHQHAILEGPAGDLEGLMATMEGEPLYEFYPLGKCFRGMANTRLYYQNFFADFQKRVIGHTIISQSFGVVGQVDEYDLLIQHDGDAGPTKHRIMSMLTFGKERITGERMLSDEKLFRTMTGPLWDKLETIG